MRSMGNDKRKRRHRNAIAVLTLLLTAVLCGAATAQNYKRAHRLIEDGDWQGAISLAYETRESHRSLARYILWRLYRSDIGNFTFNQMAAFLVTAEHWPETRAIRDRIELAMPEGLEPAAVIRFFARFPARTANGVTVHAEALSTLGREAEAHALLRNHWRNQPMLSSEVRDFRIRFRDVLRPEDHIARLDRMIWIGAFSNARWALYRVPRGYRALGEARIALATLTPGVDPLVAAVPDRLVSDPGLVYERLRWRRRKGFTDRAIELLDVPRDVSGSPPAWWHERHVLARRLIEEGDFARAYDLVAAHRQAEGLPFAQAEFLAGFLALRQLDRPEAALDHFTRLFGNVSTPISRARGAYWAGRAAMALDKPDEATAWYERAAKHGATFYGQRARVALDPTAELHEVGALQGDGAVSDEARVRFEGRELVTVVRGLHAAGLTEQAEVFVDHLGRGAKSTEDLILTVCLALELKQPGWAVRIARRGAADGRGALSIGYPTLSGDVPEDLEKALLHAVIRQESGFDAGAYSLAGARGLMQLMPRTARAVAHDVGERYDRSRLTGDPAFNLQLGSRYLRDLLDRFDGVVPLAAAGYNAGPARVSRWLRTFGDPRTGEIALLDWIELIPIYETRNYVQRISEGLEVYRWKLARRATDSERSTN